VTKTKRSGGTSKGQKADADYDIGYGRPPKATQFKPGRSGNPGGRPKGAKSEDTIVRSVMDRKVALSLGGKVRKVALLEAVWTRIADDALKGNARAQSLITQRCRTLEATAPDERAMPEDDDKVWRSYLRQAAAELKTESEDA
jgi:hypothetical protein